MFLFATLNRHSFSTTYLILKYCNCGILLNRRRCLPTTLFKINRRFYALKLYHDKTKPLLIQTLFDYIKVKNEVGINKDAVTLSNVFDFESALKQTYNVVVYSVDPSPKEVIKLFTLYASSEMRTSFHKHFGSKSRNNVLESRVVSSVPFMTVTELHQFSLLLSQLGPVKMKIIGLLKKVVLEESAVRLESVECLPDAFKYFITAMELNGYIKNYIVYDRFISVCERFVDFANPVQLSHLLYFLGLEKTRTSHSDLALTASRRLCPHFKDVSFTDAGMALMGLFKMSLNVEKDVPLSQEAAVKLMDKISTNEQSVSLNHLDSTSLISVVKYLRLTSYNSRELLQSLKLFLLKLDASSFNASFVCHTLALYANCNVYDPDVYSLLESKFLRFLQSSEEIVRIKDISRMMWALAHAQHPCSETFLKLVVQSLEQLSSTAELLTFPTHVVDAALALAMFKVFPEKLFAAILRPQLLELVRGKDRTRYLSRLLILSEVQKSACPSLSLLLPPIPVEELPKRTIQDECVHRPCIRRVTKALQWLRRKCGTPVFEVGFLVPYINYCSVALTGSRPPEAYLPSEIGRRVWENLGALDGRRVAIDVNDANTCLMGAEQRPIGLEALKRNILRMRGWTVKTLSCDDVDGCRDDEMALAALLLQTALNDYQ